jgi:hypothetical protein
MSHLTWNPPHTSEAAKELPENKSVTAQNIDVACRLVPSYVGHSVHSLVGIFSSNSLGCCLAILFVSAEL